MINQALHRFKENLPFNPWCSTDKRVRDIQSREVAIGYPYIQVNYPQIHYIVFDIDYPSAVFAPEEHDLPIPTITAVNRDNGHAHMLYELHDPVPRNHSRATRSLLRDIKAAYGDILCADKCITSHQQLIKNPLHDKWEVNPIGGGVQFNLRELIEYIPECWKSEKYKRMNEFKVSYSDRNFDECLIPVSRTLSLFDYGRYYAYKNVSECASYDNLYSIVYEHIDEANNNEIIKYFPCKLNYAEVKSIARSIARWTFDHRHNFRNINNGAMGFPSLKGTYRQQDEYEAEVKRRRQMSAERTHNIRRKSTRNKVEEAVEQCIKSGIEPTTAVISKISGVSRSTITRSYYEYIEPYL